MYNIHTMPSRKVTVRLPEELLVRLRRRASRMGIGYQTLIRILLSEALSSEATAEAATLHEPGDLQPVRWRDYGADRSLFWSSPEELPLWMVICTVLRAGQSPQNLRREWDATERLTTWIP
ncbi:CopG family antitoxin [Thermosulfurimonas sp. F29]|uniref:CopG family antitoxin n=1 Tax=Thermosulfurimonas sp. F29 TaxID=2867247 RepID=UPI00351D3843